MATPRRRAMDRNGKWHFVKTFSIDSVVQVIGMAIVIGGPILVWGSAIQSRVLTLENFNTATAAADTKRDADTREQRQALAVRVERIEEKLQTLQVTAAQILAAQQVPRSPPSGRR